MAITLKEAIQHAELIKELRCEMCGTVMKAWQDKLSMIRALRAEDGLCPSCHTIKTFYDSHGRLPNAEELWS